LKGWAGFAARVKIQVYSRRGCCGRAVDLHICTPSLSIIVLDDIAMMNMIGKKEDRSRYQLRMELEAWGHGDRCIGCDGMCMYCGLDV